jgi:transposase InsO family protein
VFVIDLASRRVQIVASTPHPGELFICEVGRSLTAAEVGLLRNHRVLIWDRDRKWSGEVGRLLNEAGLRVVQTPFRAPNANAYAERFVRSIKEECLDRIVPIGERHFRRAVSDFVAASFINVDGFGRVKGHYGPGPPPPVRTTTRPQA